MSASELLAGPYCMVLATIPLEKAEGRLVLMNPDMICTVKLENRCIDSQNPNLLLADQVAESINDLVMLSASASLNGTHILTSLVALRQGKLYFSIVCGLRLEAGSSYDSLIHTERLSKLGNLTFQPAYITFWDYHYLFSR